MVLLTFKLVDTGLQSIHHAIPMKQPNKLNISYSCLYLRHAIIMVGIRCLLMRLLAVILALKAVCHNCGFSSWLLFLLYNKSRRRSASLTDCRRHVHIGDVILPMTARHCVVNLKCKFISIVGLNAVTHVLLFADVRFVKTRS